MGEVTKPVICNHNNVRSLKWFGCLTHEATCMYYSDCGGRGSSFCNDVK